MKVIIFGGSGYLGSNIAKIFLRRNIKVTIFDTRTNEIKGPNIKFIKGNISDFKKVLKATRGHNYVLNFAGISDIGESIKKPIGTVQTNILGTVNTLEASKILKIKKYLFASSIYVSSSQGSFYRTSKHSSELYIHEYKKRFNLNYTIIRYGSIYGHNADKRNGIAKILFNFKRKRKLEYGGTKKAVRNFIYIDDACKSTADLLKKKFDNKIVNITGKKSIKVSYIMKYLKENLQINSHKITYKNKPQLGHYDRNPFSYVAPKSIHYFRKDLVSIDKGLRKIIKNF